MTYILMKKARTSGTSVFALSGQTLAGRPIMTDVIVKPAKAIRREWDRLKGATPVGGILWTSSLRDRHTHYEAQDIHMGRDLPEGALERLSPMTGTK